MADLLGGLAQGINKGLEKIDSTVDYLEKMRENRENMRLKMSQEQRMLNQDQRAQDLHGYKMQELETQLAQLKDAEAKRMMMDEVRGINNGWLNGFSPKVMDTDFYKRTFGNYNVRPASYFGKDVLAQMGIDDPTGYFVSDDGQGNFIPIKSEIFNQTTGYQLEINKIRQDEADTLSKQTKAMEDSQIQKNMEELQPLYEQLYNENLTLLQDPNAPMDKKVEAMSHLMNLGSLKPSALGQKNVVPFAKQIADEQDTYLKEIRSGDFRNYDKSLSLADNTAEQAAVQTALLDGLRTKGIDFSKPINLEEAMKGKEDLIPYVNAYVQTIAQSKGAGEVIKNMTDLFSKGSDQYLDQIGEMLTVPGEKPSRDVMTATKKALLSYAPDGYFSNAKAGSKADEDLNTVMQLFINAYGNENFGSALTVGEEGRIDRAFGSNWQNTSTFLAGAIAKIKNTIARMHDAARTNTQYANIVYGDKFLKLQRTLENLTKAREEIIEYGNYKQRNPQGTVKDFQKMKQAQSQAAQATMQPQSSSSTEPTEQQKAAMKLFEGVDL